MKIILITVFLVISIFMLPGCWKKEETTPNKNLLAKKEIVIGLSLPSADHGWLGAVITYAKEAANENGVKYIITIASNPSKQANDISDLITKKVDAIVLLPTESDPLTPSAENVFAAEIPLVIFDREIKSDKYNALIKGDNVGIGTNAGNYLAEALKGKGNIVQIQGVPCSVTEQRTKGFNDVIKKFPGIKIVATQPGDFQKEKSLTVMQNILQSQKKIDAVYTQDDEMALGVIQAIKEAKRTDIKVVTGAGGNKDVYTLIANKDPLMKATFTYSPLMIKEAIKSAIDLANGKKIVNKITTLNAEKITIENVKNYLKINAPY